MVMKEKSVLGFPSKCDVTTYRRTCLWSSRMKEAGHGKQPLRVELDLQSFLCFLLTSFFMYFRHRNILTSLLARNSSDKDYKPTYETMSLKRSFSKVPFDTHLGHRYPQSDRYINIPGGFKELPPAYPLNEPKSQGSSF